MARVWTWTPPAGGPVVLNDRAAGYRVMRARTKGLLAPPYRASTTSYAGLDGTELTELTADARPVALDLKVEADNVLELRARVHALVRALRPKAGAGVLTVTDEAGVALSIGLRYTGGLEGADELRNDGAWRGLPPFAADDPWWYGNEEAIPALLPPSRGFFPVFPLRFPGSTIDVRGDVVNAGDGDSSPVWTVQGPGVGPRFTNYTTGRAIALSSTLAAGQSLTVDTRPGHQAVTRSDGTNLFGDLATAPAMWQLAPGVNDVGVTMTGATGASAVLGTSRPRYSGLV